MPPNASIVIFDDNAGIRETTRELLINGGHTVIGEAGSVDGLEKLLERLKNETLTTQIVALVDNNAPWCDGEEPDSKGVGRIAVQMIKVALMDVITVATTSSTAENVGYGDYRYQSGAGTEGLSAFIDLLPAKER